MTTTRFFAREIRVRTLNIRDHHLELQTLERDLCTPHPTFVELIFIWYKLRDTEVETRARGRAGWDKNCPGIFYHILIYVSRGPEISGATEKQYLRERVPRRITLKIQRGKSPSARVPDRIPNQNYTSKRKVQGKVMRCLSGETLIATLYAMEWMFTIMSRRRRRECWTNDGKVCKFYNETRGRVNNIYSGA